MAEENIDFQDLPCSGAVIGEVLQGGHKSQIDAWTHPDKADIATLSISGNDIGFYLILTACVLCVGQEFAGDCDTAVRDTNNKISDHDLFNGIAQALRKILAKSGCDDFKIYLTGHPTFFDAVTDSCDYTTFYYWQPGHHFFHQPGNWAYLYKALRMQLNSLVTNLNTMLSQVADSVNRQYLSQRVWFVDPNPIFTGHRFCEIDVIEPDASCLDTWLFLSGWDDHSLPNTESAQDSHDQQLNALTAGTSVTLPDPTSCNTALGQSMDWADRMLCDTAMAVKEYAPGNYKGPSNATSAFDADLQAMKDQNYTAVEVSWWVPTRQAKTFHPRTLGQQAYKLAITDVW